MKIHRERTSKSKDFWIIRLSSCINKNKVNFGNLHKTQKKSWESRTYWFGDLMNYEMNGFRSFNEFKEHLYFLYNQYLEKNYGVKQ